MRLDHLLSKEEVVRVVLLLRNQGRKNLMKRKEPEHSVVQEEVEAGGLAGTDFAEQRKAKGDFLAEILLVAMRLWVTPVLIPNTMVKT